MPNKLKILGIVLLVLAGAWIYLAWRSSRIESSSPFKDVNPDAISMIRLTRAGKTVALVNKGDSCRMTSPVDDLADSTACHELAEAMPKISIGSIAAEKPSSYDDYGLETASSTRIEVVVSSHDNNAPFFVGIFGKSALGYDSLYFRYPNRPQVFLAAGLPSYQIDKDPDDFRERALFPGTSWQSIRIASGKTFFEIRKSTSGYWAFAGRKPPSADADALSQTLSNLRLEEFLPRNGAPSDRQAGFERPILDLTAASAKGATDRWIIGTAKKVKGGEPVYRYAKALSRNAAGLAAIYDVDSILKNLGLKRPAKSGHTK